MRTKKTHRLSAGVVVVHCVQSEFHFLLLRAYRNWDFPKGMVEPGESPFVAANREVQEETGLSRLEFRWGEIYIETEPYAGGKIARYYLAYSPSSDVTLPINPALGRPEHHEYRWLAYDAAHASLVPRGQTVLAWAQGITGKSC